MSRKTMPRRSMLIYHLFVVSYLQIVLHFSTALADVTIVDGFKVPVGSFIVYPIFFTLLMFFYAVESSRRFAAICASALLTNLAIVTFICMLRYWSLTDIFPLAVSSAAIYKNLWGTSIVAVTLILAIISYQFFRESEGRIYLGIYYSILLPLLIDAFAFAIVLNYYENRGFWNTAICLTISNLFFSFFSSVIISRYIYQTKKHLLFVDPTSSSGVCRYFDFHFRRLSHAERLEPANRDTPRPDDIYLDLNAEGLAAQADVAWIDAQHNIGAFADYRGEYIAVVGKKLLGHHKSLTILRNEVSQATGYSPLRIVTTFIDLPTY